MPQANIPKTRLEREGLKTVIARYVEANRNTLTPPLVLDELRIHAEKIVDRAGMPRLYTDYVGVLLNNEVWREQLATVPYERRLLLMPKCLRVEDRCPAPFDELGLLCKQCGLCTIQDLQAEAERLGYAVLVAEGSALVMALIQTGQIEAIVGVSCLSVLEKAFPYMESAAIPGVAIPLLQDDCKDTSVDVDWVWDMIHLTSDDRTWRLDLDKLRDEIKLWFEPTALDQLFGTAVESETDQIARDWLARDGKRWRPLLTACAYKAFQDDPNAPLPEGVRKVALAVECFHKASLIHDDIEDNDDERYGRQTLHAEYGVPVALNVGDLLVGEGYRLIAESGAPSKVIAEMIRIASAGHRSLCLGQGAEMCWTRRQRPLSVQEVLSIFRQKTAPAFEVALRLGAAYAEAGPDVHEVLKKYSEALGIAYQIRDDLEDLETTPSLQSRDREGALTTSTPQFPTREAALTEPRPSGSGPRRPTAPILNPKPTLPLAEALARAKGADKLFLNAIWTTSSITAEDSTHVRELFDQLDIESRCRQLLESYKEAAVRSLPDLHNPSLKGLLRRVIGKIFRVEIQGWCSEFEARNAAGSAALTQTAG
ncbi:MAG: polyprenyl synthetase family protein [Bryobacterales bacterium]|nr:polyprenyl synthetase family protein [Bryobacterales bacterium]